MLDQREKAIAKTMNNLQRLTKNKRMFRKMVDNYSYHLQSLLSPTDTYNGLFLGHDAFMNV